MAVKGVCECQVWVSSTPHSIDTKRAGSSGYLAGASTYAKVRCVSETLPSFAPASVVPSGKEMNVKLNSEVLSRAYFCWEYLDTTLCGHCSERSATGTKASGEAMAVFSSTENMHSSNYLEPQLLHLQHGKPLRPSISNTRTTSPARSQVPYNRISFLLVLNLICGRPGRVRSITECSLLVFKRTPF